MPEPILPPPPSAAPCGLPWYLWPYLHVVVSSLLTAVSQPLLKRGSEAVGEHNVFAVRALTSGWTWLGILAVVTSLLSWIYALRHVPLTLAYNLTAIAYVLVPLSAWLFLGEHISPKRWSGILLVTIGVLVIVREAARLDEKL